MSSDVIEKFENTVYQLKDMINQCCLLFQVFPGSKSKYLTAITSKEYFRFQTTLNGSIGGLAGYLSKTGDDPGNLLYYTGHPADACPCKINRFSVDGLTAFSANTVSVFDPKIKNYSFITLSKLHIMPY